jgi:hypothetical protein
MGDSSTTDPDAGDTFTCSLVGGAAGPGSPPSGEFNDEPERRRGLKRKTPPSAGVPWGTPALSSITSEGE